MDKLNALIVTILDNLIDIDDSKYSVFRLNEQHRKENDILCFIPNREIPSNGRMSICFIPFSREHGNDYKNNARAIRYNLGGDKYCHIVDIDFTYKIHKKIGLPHSEEVHVLLLVIEFLLENDAEITVSHKLDLTEKQNQYFDNLVKEGKVKLLYE